MEIKVKSAASPRFSNKEKTAIDLEVKFSHLDEVVPFTSMKGESGYTGELYEEALAGKYGEILPWVDNIIEFNTQVSIERQRKELSEVTVVIDTLSDKLELFGPDKETEDRLKKLKLHRITIMELDKDPKWPYVEFPEMP